MTTNEIRERFLEFFEERGHAIIPSASLVPQDDPSVLFTTAGMHPLVPYLMGEKHPLGKRLADSQKCLRTDDIDEVGDVQHLTFFEMLGYWSLGDYFKKKSIHFTFDFYTQILGFNKDDISVTVFAGDNDAPFDQESFDTWKNEIGIPEKRIYKYPKKENWWGPVSETGPCGPCTEMFIDTGISACGPDCGPSCDCDKFVEIGNNVFMEYFKDKEGKFEKLQQKNVDVGLGLERLAMFSQKKETVFEIDVFAGIMAKIKELAKKEEVKSTRVIADHVRAATFALAEGVEPSNVDRGYVVRRLIRRAVRHGRLLGIEGVFTKDIAKEVVKAYKEIYPELSENEQFIYSELDKEEEKFSKTIDLGLREIKKWTAKVKTLWEDELSDESLLTTGEKAFDFFQTYGFPLEMVLEELNSAAEEKGISVKESLIQKGFENEFKKHQELSRKGAEKKFKGGLGEQTTETTKYHTASHLLLEALRRVLGTHVYQKGSNITSERLRLDFSHPEKMTEEEVKRAENIVNEQIKANLSVIEEITTVEDAKGKGAMGVFDEKYGEKIKVYSIGGPLESREAFSKEICGGPHVESTAELGHFKITKEESSSAGVRRIKAILE